MTSLERAFEEIDRFVENRITEVNMPGLVLAVTDREKSLRVVPFGYADLSSGRPMQPSSMFEIGSIGKSFTNVALMQLRDEGRLHLHEPVSRYLPWFEVQSDFGPITPHHLMTHTSGLVTGTDIAPHGLMNPGPCGAAGPALLPESTSATQISDTRLWVSYWRKWMAGHIKTLYKGEYSTRWVCAIPTQSSGSRHESGRP